MKYIEVKMAKVVGTIRNEFRFLGIKLFDFTKQYKVLSTEEDTEEIRDDIYLHELITQDLESY
jgi:hypothetical protein